MRRIRFLGIFIALTAVAIDPAPLRAQSAEALFDANVLHEIRLFINSRELQQLRRTFNENTIYPADLQWRDVRVRNVGIRSRGRDSRNATKPGLQIEFGRYASGQRFLGLETLVLDNLWQDPSLVREHVAMAFFRRAGVPAPRVSLGRLFINNVFQGVYGIVEGVDASFLERAFSDKIGYLFEFHYQAEPFQAEYLGSDYAAYRSRFEPRTHVRDAETSLYSPIRDLFREVNESDEVTWRERVGSLVDLDALLSHLAAETFLAEADGLAGSFIGMNNFYLHRRTDDPRHRLIPWDRDLSFFDLVSPITPNFDQNQLFRRVMADGELRELYLQKLEACVRLATEDDWLLNEIDRAVTLVTAAAYADRWKRDSNEAFDLSTAFLKEFALLRPGVVTEGIVDFRKGER
jgi:spore coat protein CotH